jgi:uncharacterized protein (TIGR03067 family)
MILAKQLTVSLAFLLLMAGCADRSPNGTDANRGVPDTRPDQERIQGKWRIVSAVQDGIPVPANLFPEVSLFLGNEFFRQQRDQKDGRSMSFTLDTGATPKGLDFTETVQGITVGKEMKRNQETWFHPGIYKLEGDRLTVCYKHGKHDRNAPRPTDFDAKEGSACLLMVLERVQP